MLTSVEYPTGGRTQFVYEPHEYSRIVNDARNGFLQETGITGGLRIKSITDFDGTNSLTRNFEYVKDYKDGGSTSSGILGLKPKYYFKDWRTTTSYDQPYIESIFSTNTIIPLANYFGTHIGYSEVTEERADGSFTTFKFTSHEDYMDESPYGTLSIQLSPYQRFNDRGFLRGKLKEKAEFDYTRQIKRKTVYRFNDGFDQKYGLATNAMWGYASAPTNGQKYYRGQAWKIYYMDFDVKEEEITLYQAGQSVTELTRFIKEDIHRPSNHVRLTKQIIKDISGDQFKTVFRYPIDLVAHDNMQPLIDANRLGEIVWTENFKNNDWIGVKKISYRTENSLFVPAIIRTSSTDHENLREELVFDKYDNKGNVLQFHGVDGLVTSVVWCYGTTRPSIIIKGATYDEVLAAFAALSISISDVNYTWHWSETDFRARVAALRTQLPNAHILHYTYNSFGISSESDANGTTTFHEYDDLGRLKLTKDFDGNILKKNTYQFK